MSDPRDRGNLRHTRVLLMAEYVEQPLWNRTPGQPNDSIDYEELGLSEELSEQLDEWNTKYGANAFELPDEEWNRQFTAEGAALARELQEELGASVEVVYVDGFHGTPKAPSPVVGSGDPGDYHWREER